MMLTVDEYMALRRLITSERESEGTELAVDGPVAAPAAKKRKVSKYSKQFGKEIKKLIAKHPRTDVTRLMKRAHTNTRKALK
jgi:hypothetical protein